MTFALSVVLYPYLEVVISTTISLRNKQYNVDKFKCNRFIAAWDIKVPLDDIGNLTYLAVIVLAVDFKPIFYDMTCFTFYLFYLARHKFQVTKKADNY